MADVGLAGYPNAGKSTLLSVVSAARPKIASYPFTTLTPNLGVVWLKEGTSFVLADIPGLIEGAHEGVGLGTGFLKHIERTRLILHLIDAAGVDGRDPVEDYHKINKELELYSVKLAACPQIVVANKADLPAAKDHIERLEEAAAGDGREFYVISAATTAGTEALMERAGRVVEELKKSDSPAELVEKLVFPRKKPVAMEDYEVIQENGDYAVEGPGLARLMRRLDLENPETISYLQNLFEKIGLYATLAKMNVPEGATVKVGELEFEYTE